MFQMRWIYAYIFASEFLIHLYKVKETALISAGLRIVSFCFTYDKLNYAKNLENDFSSKLFPPKCLKYKQNLPKCWYTRANFSTHSHLSDKLCTPHQYASLKDNIYSKLM